MREKAGRGAPRILVVGPAWVGDMVMAQSLFRILKDRFPDGVIDVLAPESTRPLLGRMPEVSEAIDIPLGHGQLGLGTRLRLARELGGRDYDRAVVTKRSFKSTLIPFLAGIPRRTGFLGELRYGLLNDVRPLDEEELPLAVQRYAVLGIRPGERLGPDDPPRPRLVPDSGRQRVLAEALELRGEGPVLGIVPGAEYGPSKRWPVERWGELARDLAGTGWRVWVFGSPKEVELGRRVKEVGGDAVRDLTGRTELADVVDLMDLCGTVVTNDSGLMHVAAAVGARVVALFGSTNPGHTPPLTDRKTVLWLDLECSPCHEPVCPLGHHHCMTKISVERVRQAVLDG